MGILRRLRSILKTGLLWVVFWVPFSLVLNASLFTVGAWPFTVIQLLEVVAVYAGIGFLTGTAFGALMAFAEARTSLSGLRPWRVALWGALASLVFPAASLGWGLLHGWLFPSLGILALNFGGMVLAGAGSAAGMVTLARRAPLPPPDEQPLLP